MEFGVNIFPTDTTMQPMELATRTEALGFESLWFPEHSHIPTDRTTPWGGREGAPPLPEQYWRTHDQFVALTAAAAVTTTLKLGTGITLVAQRDPIWLAKEVASLDMISNGRLLFGIGYGWNKEEMAHHGVQYAERRAAVREKVLAMKELWTKDEAAFAGDHVNFSSSWSWPKPITKPHPPVILGSSGGPKTFEHIIEFCDGWMPIAGRTPVLEQVTHLRRAAEDAGRDPATIELGVFQIRPEAQHIDPLIEAGFARALFGLPQGEAVEVAEHLEYLAEFVRPYR
ncbi:MAG: TIGR03619 family F420-dependent LLM class oxidoreductase [Acidimicrobiia bacterium]|nr:TIGR03619 family F420-dependent LLM class oxidoreductase [Acidimicrobiia bacterium]MDH5421085.1 TIGR03619 family F420-dependent LLM class oxidoreductase [Acidimicrobiia bacterium]MDH5502640.1 TIGR03619 family F420-dependent LLM class oxidoreductase [Acidimicrobiia bacterium]